MVLQLPSRHTHTFAAAKHVIEEWLGIRYIDYTLMVILYEWREIRDSSQVWKFSFFGKSLLRNGDDVKWLYFFCLLLTLRQQKWQSSYFELWIHRLMTELFMKYSTKTWKHFFVCACVNQNIKRVIVSINLLQMACICLL